MRYLPYQLVQDFFHQQYVNQTNQVFLYCTTTTEQKKNSWQPELYTPATKSIPTYYLCPVTLLRYVQSRYLPHKSDTTSAKKTPFISSYLDLFKNFLDLSKSHQPNNKNVFFCVLFHHKIIWWWHSYQTSTCQGQKSHTHGEDESNQLPGFQRGQGDKQGITGITGIVDFEQILHQRPRTWRKWWLGWMCVGSFCAKENWQILVSEWPFVLLCHHVCFSEFRLRQKNSWCPTHSIMHHADVQLKTPSMRPCEVWRLHTTWRLRIIASMLFFGCKKSVAKSLFLSTFFMC